MEAVKALLNRDANPNAPTNFARNIPLIETIMEKQTLSDLSITNRQGRNAFHISVVRGNQNASSCCRPG